MRALLFAFIALPLAACVSPGELRTRSPVLEESSAKGAKAVAGCIADRWEAGGNKPNLSARPTANGYALTAETDLGLYGKDTGFIVDVADTKDGSISRFYSNLALSSWVNIVSAIVRDCQK